MTNPFAGEVSIQIDGVDLPCKLTLGALAELETSMKADTLMALIARFETQAFRASDILDVVVAGLRGAGWQGQKSDLLASEIGGGPVAAAQAAAQLLALAFAGQQDG